jgi:hypothetical protein
MVLIYLHRFTRVENQRGGIKLLKGFEFIFSKVPQYSSWRFLYFMHDSLEKESFNFPPDHSKKW